jgi:heptosyltransferase-1
VPQAEDGQRISDSSRNILVVRLGAIGDVAQTLPAVLDLKSYFPQYNIYWAIEDKSRPLLESIPEIQLLTFPKKKIFQKNLFAAWKENRAFRTILHQKNFLFSIDYQGLFKSGWLSYLSGAPERFGFHRNNTREANHLFLTHMMPYQSSSDIHKIDFYRRLSAHVAKTTVIPKRENFFPFSKSESDSYQQKFLKMGIQKPFIVMNTGTSKETKRWRVDYLIHLCRLLQEQYPVFQLCITGAGQKDTQYCKPLFDSISHPLSLLDKLSLRELAYLVSESKMVISPDSLCLHLASIQNVPAIGIFGGTCLYACQGGPWNQPLSRGIEPSIQCYPCRLSTCSHHSCMKENTVERVFSEVGKILSHSS